MILRLVAVALLDLPKTVILPGQHMVRIGLQRALVPHLRKLVVAEFAIGIADQVGDVGVLVVAKRLKLLDRRIIVVAVIDRRIGGAIAPRKGGIVEQRLLPGRLLLGYAFGLASFAVWRRRRGRGAHVVFSRPSAAASGGKHRNDGGRSDHRQQERCDRHKPGHWFEHLILLLAVARSSPRLQMLTPLGLKHSPPKDSYSL